MGIGHNVNNPYARPANFIEMMELKSYVLACLCDFCFNVGNCENGEAAHKEGR